LRSLVVGGGSFTPRDLVLVDFCYLGSHLKTKGGDFEELIVWLRSVGRVNRDRPGHLESDSPPQPQIIKS
jgi:hypothetical protein